MIKAIYFDLFFTLIEPLYKKENNEFDILNLSVKDWEQYAEDETLYYERAIGLVKSEKEIIDKIISIIPFDVSNEQKEKVLIARENRMKRALENVSDEIVDVLKKIKTKGIKIGLISNADVIDCKYWYQTELGSMFDDVIFSCNVGMLKPDKKIYDLAMQHLNVLPSECIFVGDGGSNELYGAKTAGMKTVFTEAIEVKTELKRACIMEHADYYIKNFAELLNCV